MIAKDKLEAIKLVVVCLWSVITHAQFEQIDFVPPVRHYSQRDYHSGTQNWSVSQESNGVIYVANNKGLLSFDGHQWKAHHVRGRKIIRSLCVDSGVNGERIYVGSFEEFGYFEKTSSGTLVYHSLSALLSDYNFQNDEIWTIVSFHGKIYFQSFSSYFVYDGTAVQVHKPTPAPLAMFSLEGKLFMQAIDSDFCVFERGEWIPLVSRKQLNDDNVVGIYHTDSAIGLITGRNGIYTYNLKNKSLQKQYTSVDRQLSEAVVNRAIVTQLGDIVLGTLTQGVYVLNPKGEIRWHIDKTNGLGNNTVLGIYEDGQQNLWVALDNGVACIQTNSKLQYHDLQSDIELLEGMEVFQNNVYLASNKGLYTLDVKTENVMRFPNFDSQVWFVKKIDKQLFVGHNKGTSVIRDGQMKSLDHVGVGGMDIKKGIIHGREILAESSYTFITIYQKTTDEAWYPSHNIEGFSDLIDKIEIDPAGNIWANHVHKGVYRIQLQDDLMHIRKVEEWAQIDSLGGGALQLLSLRGNPVFADGSKFYIYDQEQQIIKPSELLSSLESLAKTKRIVPVSDYKFWFITDKDYNLVVFEDGQYRLSDKIPFSSIIKPSSEERATIYVNAIGQSYFCLNGSIALYNSAIREQNKYQLILTSLKSYGRNDDRTISESISGKIQIDYTKNNLIFEFQYPDYSQQELRLRYYLENYDRQWSEISGYTFGYQQLPQGDYLLKVFVTNSLNEELSQLQIPFSITTPWYRSWWAYVMYAIVISLFCVGVLWVYFHLKIKQKEKIYKQEQTHRMRMLEQQEREIAKLRTEKLEVELEHKSKALASATMLNVRNDEFLEKLLLDFEQFLDVNKISRRQGQAIIQHIREHISNEDEWQLFQENFDMIHKNFFRNLKMKYPNLTASDLRLCVLLRLNYSTKEIASMQGVSVRGVETARYRLRKKLNLTEEDSLTDFLIAFQ